MQKKQEGTFFSSQKSNVPSRLNEGGQCQVKMVMCQGPDAGISIQCSQIPDGRLGTLHSPVPPSIPQTPPNTPTHISCTTAKTILLVNSAPTSTCLPPQHLVHVANILEFKNKHVLSTFCVKVKKKCHPFLVFFCLWHLRACKKLRSVS